MLIYISINITCFLSFNIYLYNRFTIFYKNSNNTFKLLLLLRRRIGSRKSKQIYDDDNNNNNNVLFLKINTIRWSMPKVCPVGRSLSSNIPAINTYPADLIRFSGKLSGTSQKEHIFKIKNKYKNNE